MTQPLSISAIVITKNEEENLPECLERLAWADEVLVVDSYSTDNTFAMAQKLATRALQHPFSNFAAQRNFAQAQATHDWVFFVDADERVSEELGREIRDLADSGRLPENNAYHVSRVALFSGRWFPDPTKRRLTPALRESIRRYEVIRLFDRRLTVWERAVQEVARVPQPHGALDNLIYHYPATNLSLAFADFNYYSDLEAALLHRTRTRASLAEAIFRGIRCFVYLYLFSFGGLYRYGEQGFLTALLGGYMKFVNYAKLWERIRIQNGQGIWTERDRKLLERFSTEGHDVS